MVAAAPTAHTNNQLVVWRLVPPISAATSHVCPGDKFHLPGRQSPAPDRAPSSDSSPGWCPVPNIRSCALTPSTRAPRDPHDLPLSATLGATIRPTSAHRSDHSWSPPPAADSAADRKLSLPSLKAAPAHITIAPASLLQTLHRASLLVVADNCALPPHQSGG